MKYVAIDLKALGGEPTTCNIIEFAAIIEDTENPLGFEEVPQFPLVVATSIEELTKTKEVEEALTNLGVLSDIYRVKASRKIRAGKGKRRGRKMKQAVGPLIVVAENKGIIKAGKNIPGVDVTTVNNLNTEILAPGTHSGRLTLWSSSAIERLNKSFSGGKEE